MSKDKTLKPAEPKVQLDIEVSHDIDNEYEENECCGYECLVCGNCQEFNDWGGECEKCSAKCLEPIFY